MAGNRVPYIQQTKRYCIVYSCNHVGLRLPKAQTIFQHAIGVKLKEMHESGNVLHLIDDAEVLPLC